MTVASACYTERYDAAGIASAADPGVSVSPGSLLVERRDRDTRVLAVGRPGDVDHHPAAGSARRLDLGDSVIIPALVNAHAHLDLTDVGAQPHRPEAGFGPFIDLVRARRPRTSEGICAAVDRGIRLSIAGGTAAIGDIAGAVQGEPRTEAWLELARSPLAGVSFIEFFAMGSGEAAGIRRIESVFQHIPASASAVLRLGIQPHAPYSVSPAGYRCAVHLARFRGMPVATHLAESLEEREFVERGAGPIRSLLEGLGLWHDGLLETFGRGRTPVRHVLETLDGPVLAVHVNHASDDDIKGLASVGASVVYCPRASEYFGAERVFGPHRYRDMIAAGINVALGTDSIINLWDGGDPQRLSVLDEMRLLFRRDGARPETLLAMGTVNGARALGLDPAAFGFVPGEPVAGVLAIRIDERSARATPLEAALRSGEAPRWLAGFGAPAR